MYQKRYAPLFPTPTADPIAAFLAGLSYIERRRWLRKNVASPYPRFLYRYTKLEPDKEESVRHLRQTLVDSELWLSSPTEFNDPFDMSFEVVFSGNGARKRNVLDHKFKELFPQVGWVQRKKRINQMMAEPSKTLARIQNSFRNNFGGCGVCCFTPNPKNLLMWSHYAASHTGIVLQFHPACDPGIFTRPAPVVYSDHYPTVDWANDTFGEIRKALFVKSSHWQYENEWRIIHPAGANTKLIFGASALTGIITGCRASDETISTLIALLDERNKKGLPAIALYKAAKHPSEFRLTAMRM